MRAIVIKVLAFFCKLFFNIEVSGIENIPKEKGKIFAPNHVSYLDGFVIAAVLPKEFSDKSIFLSKVKHTWFAPKLFRYFGILSFGKDNTNILKESEALLKNGKHIVIFPEGTRSKSLSEFRRGFALLAQNSNALVVPVAIYKKRRVYKISFLPAIEAQETMQMTCDLTRRAIEARIEELCK